MTDRNQLEVYLARVTRRFDVLEAYAVLVRFMCHCLLLVRHFLPEIGTHALDSARAFWLDGNGQPDALLAARLECWSYLEAKGSSTEVQDQEDAAMRAVICVLYAEPEPESDDFSAEAVRWFATMFDRLGNHSSEATQLVMS
jgi:hypothetical protein